MNFEIILCLWNLIICSVVASSRIVQRSDGCGPHPLVALVAASRSYESSGSSPSLSEVLRMVKANPEVWATMSTLLRRYDDCIRAGDGLHFKRSGKIQTSSFVKSSLPDENFNGILSSGDDLLVSSFLLK